MRLMRLFVKLDEGNPAFLVEYTHFIQKIIDFDNKTPLLSVFGISCTIYGRELTQGPETLPVLNPEIKPPEYGNPDEKSEKTEG